MVRTLKLWLSAVVCCSLAPAISGCYSSNTFSSSIPTLSLPVASLSASTIAFGTIPLGQNSATQTVTLTNTGSSSLLQVSSIKVTGSSSAAFLSSSNCPAGLPKGASCTIDVIFSPNASGALAGTLTIADNAAGGVQTVGLTGTGSSSGPVVSFSTSSLTFATLPIGQASTQTVTVSNIGSYTLNLAGATLGGTNATSFAISGTCLTSSAVPAGGSCFLTVTYSPTVNGSLSAQVNLNDNAPNTPQIVTLATR